MTLDTSSALLRSLHDPAEFTLTFELVPGRGGRSRALTRTLDLAARLAAGGRFQAMSITENAGGHPALSPEALGAEVRAMGLEVIIHFTCKDKNRNQMESMLFSWDRQNLHNLLVLAGDYPKQGYQGFPKPVFDLDTVHALDMISSMNRGESGICRGMEDITPTSFSKGVAVSPFKLHEAELVMQYNKLRRKVAAGADYVITQVGFDARKFEELLLFMKHSGLAVPVLGNVFVPSLAVAEHMYRGRVPGCVLSRALFEEMREEARGRDGGRRARLIRAAKLLAVLKGLGYAGAHIGGPGLSGEDLDFLLAETEAIAADWRLFVPQLADWPEEAFWYFSKNTRTGLNEPEPGPRPAGRRFVPAYEAARTVHNLCFTPGGSLFGLSRKACLALDESRFQGLFQHYEHLVKMLLFGCRNCGDCTLSELAFLCPQSGCAKNILNGPCGGSRDGWCEVYPGKRRCLYVLAYERLKTHGLEGIMGEGYVPPRNWALNDSSSWVNFFRGRDHTAARREVG